MKAYIITVFIYLLIETLARIAYMAIKDWPHTHERTIGLFAAETCAFIGFLVWAGVLLFS